MNRSNLTTLFIALLVATLPGAIAAQHIHVNQSRPNTPRAEPRDLFGSAAAGDLERVKQLLNEGANVNDVNPRSRETALIAALQKNQVEVATYLLDHGADVTLQDRLGTTALQMAAHWGHADLVERIIQLGADINAVSSDGRRPIHYATRRAHIDSMKLLIAHGADIHSVSGFGNAPIDLALELDSPEAAYLLIESGARLTDDPNRATDRIATAVHKHWVPIVEHILEEASDDPALTARLTNAAYDAAVGPGHDDLLVALANHGGGISERTVAGVTRLFQACVTGSEVLVTRLLESGLDPNEVSQPSGWTPLHAAMLGGSIGVVESLLGHGAAVSVTDGLRRTPLHVAVALDRTDIVKRLLRAGADPSAVEFNGDTPLHYAALTGNRAIAEALLNTGASPDAMNADGITPIAIAELNGRVDIFESLDRPSAPEQPLPPGIAALVRAFNVYEEGPSPEQFRAQILAQVQSGTPQLHLAVSQRAGDVVEELLAANPDLVNERDAYGYQPLHKAAESGDPDIVALLLGRGADVNDGQNLARWTPLHFAASARHAQIARTLLDSGARRTAADATGRTPADVARDMNSPELENMLR